MLGDESWRHSPAVTAPWFDPVPGATPIRPQEWAQARESVPVRVVDVEVTDPDVWGLEPGERPGGLAGPGPGRLGGAKQLVRYEVRRIPVGDRFVREFTVRVQWDQELVAPGTGDRMVAQAQAGLDEMVNDHGYRLPNGDQIHVRVEVVPEGEPADPTRVRLTRIRLLPDEATAGTDQVRWKTSATPREIGHEALHFTGLTDGNVDKRRVFLANKTRSRVVPGGPMSSDPGPLTPRGAWLIEHTLTSQHGLVEAWNPHPGPRVAPELGTDEAARSDDWFVPVSDRPYAHALGELLGGQGPVDFARVLTILRQANARRDGPLLEQAFAAEHGRTLRAALEQAREDDRLTEVQMRRVPPLMGWEREPELPAHAPAPPHTGVRRNQAPKDLPQVRGYAKAVESAPAEVALALVARLDRDPRKLWPVQAVYRLQTGGRDLAEDLREALPLEQDYIDHVFAESPAQFASWKPGAEPVPVEWDAAREWFERVMTMTFEHWTGDYPMPHTHLEDGCDQRAHLVAVELIRLGTFPRKIFVNAEDLWVPQTLPDGTRERVDWWHHVAALVYTRNREGHADWMVWDPAMAREPLTVRQWLASMGVDADTAERLEGPAHQIIDTFEQRRTRARDLNRVKFHWTANGYLRRPTVVVTDAHAMNLSSANLLPAVRGEDQGRADTLQTLHRALEQEDLGTALIGFLSTVERRDLGGETLDAMRGYLHTHDGAGTPPAEDDIADFVLSRLEHNPLRVGLLKVNPTLDKFLQQRLPTRYGDVVAATNNSEADRQYARRWAIILQGTGSINFREVLDLVRQATARRDGTFLQAAYQSAYQDQLAGTVGRAHAAGRLSGTQATRMARLMGWEPEPMPLSPPHPPHTAVRPGEQPKDLPQVRRYAEAVREQIQDRRADAALALVARLDRNLPTMWAVQGAYRIASGGRELIADLRSSLPDESDYIDQIFADRPAKIVSVPWDTALDWLTGLDGLPSEPGTKTSPLPHGHPENEAAEQAHRETLELLRLGTYPQKIFLSGEGIRVSRGMPDGSRREVRLKHYAAIMVMTLNKEGTRSDWMVWDPKLVKTPVTPQQWLTLLGIPDDAMRERQSGPTEVIIEYFAKLRAQDPSRWTPDGYPIDPAVVITNAHAASLSPGALLPPVPDSRIVRPATMHELDNALRGFFDEPDVQDTAPPDDEAGLGLGLLFTLGAPKHWEPVHNTADPLFATLATIWKLPSVGHARRKINHYLNVSGATESQRRAEADNGRQRGEIDDTQWQVEQQQRQDFDQWLADHRKLLAADPTAPRDADDVDATLHLAADVYGRNVISVHPDGHVSEIQVDPAQPTTFVRHTSDGHYEIGVESEFGGDLLEKLGVELSGTTSPERPDFDRPPTEPPPLLDNERLLDDQGRQVLSAQDKERLLPILGVPVKLPRPSGDSLTLVDRDGKVLHLPAVSSVRATWIRPKNKPSYYIILYPDGKRDRIPYELAKDFTFERDKNGYSGELRWEVWDDEVRFLGTDDANKPTSIYARYDTPVVVTSRGSESWTVKLPGGPRVSVKAPDTLFPPLPTLADRHHDPMFGEHGPLPEDVRQGAAGDCILLAKLKQLAARNPQAIRDIVRDRGDGTVSVRFTIRTKDQNGHETVAFEWVRVEKQIYVTPGTTTGHFAHHEPGQPLWASMIEKAYSLRFNNDDGYHGFTDDGDSLTTTAERLLGGFYRAPDGTLDQPVQAVGDEGFLNPLRFDIDTVHALVDHLVRADTPPGQVREADPEFSRRIAGSYTPWARERRVLRTAMRQHGKSEKRTAADIRAGIALMGRYQEFNSPRGFRKYLDELFPQQWDAEKDALTKYFRTIYGGRAADRVLPDDFAFVAQVIGHQIEYAHKRGDTVTIGTQPFGRVGENTTAVPGLVGGHEYSLLLVEHDRTGAPARLLLENPWNRQPWNAQKGYRTPGDGIEYRLDPHGTDNYATDANGTRYRYDPDGTRYIILADRTQYRRDPDGTEYGLSPDGSRMHKSPDQTRQITNPDGSRYRETPDGTKYWTSPDGTDKRRRAPGQTAWFSDPDRIDPPDTTVPPRGGIVAVEFRHLSKFGVLSMDGAGAHGLYGPDHPASTGPHRTAPHPGSDPALYYPVREDDYVGPDTRIDSDGVRVFTSDRGGLYFGHYRLRAWPDLTDDERAALRVYEKTSQINAVVRQNMSREEITRWIDEFRENYETVLLLTGENETAPSLGTLHDRHIELHTKDERTPGEERELQALNTILYNPRPAARWHEITTGTFRYITLDDEYRKAFGQGLTPDIVMRHRELLDRVTHRELPLSGPILLMRGLDDVDFMVVDQDGTPLGKQHLELLINVPQREPAFMSLSLTADLSSYAKDCPYRLELVVPPGARGVFIGADGVYPRQQELLLARDAHYMIIGVEHFPEEGPTGVTVLRAVLMPSSISGDGPVTAMPLAPIDDPANRSYLDERGVRRFPNDLAGALFGVRALRFWDGLPEDVQTTLATHVERPLVAYYDSGEFDDELGEEQEPQQISRHESHGNKPISSYGTLSRDVSTVDFDEYHDFEPRADPRKMAQLDQATGRELPLDEPILVTRNLRTIGFMLDKDRMPLKDREPGLLVDVLQRERGYLSALLGPDPQGDTEYRLELVVPPGTRGAYVGREDAHTLHNELMLARGTRYRVTGIRKDGDITVLEAEVVPRPGPFEPEGDDTYFGEDLLEKLGPDRTGPTEPESP